MARIASTDCALVRTAGMGEHALDLDPGALQEFRDLHQFGAVGLHARTMAVRIDLDQHVEVTCAGERFIGEQLGGFHAVQDQRQLHPLRLQGRDVRELVGRDADRVQDVLVPVPGEIVRLQQRRDGDGAPRGQDPAGDVDRLVGLDVRAERHAEPGQARSHALDVAIHALRVQQQRGRFQLIQRWLRHRQLPACCASRFSTRPGREPVDLPSCHTTAPLTITLAMPRAGAIGFS